MALIDGVLIYPTFPSTAMLHGQSLIKLAGVGYPAIFNAIGFPAVNVPVGLNKQGLPIGVSVSTNFYSSINNPMDIIFLG